MDGSKHFKRVQYGRGHGQTCQNKHNLSVQIHMWLEVWLDCDD